MNRRCPLWIWFASAAIALFTIYLLAFGMVANLITYGGLPDGPKQLAEAIYSPLLWAVNDGPPSIRALAWRLLLWTGFRMDG